MWSLWYWIGGESVVDVVDFCFIVHEGVGLGCDDVLWHKTASVHASVPVAIQGIPN
jgi:hypothetical protein